MKVEPLEKHFTSSVWIVTKGSPKKVLLIFHKKFRLWIQPGGHIEKYENPIEAAIRETYEETGIDISSLKKKITSYKDVDFLPKPDFTLEAKIPAYKKEPPHFHIDMMYVVKIKETIFQQNIKETNGIGYFTKEEALKLPLHDDSMYIINKLLK